MLQLFPFLAGLATVTSAVLLTVFWRQGELGRAGAALLVCWFLLAGYFQFLGGAAFIQAAGLGFQTILAVGLLLRWKARA